MTPHHNHGLHRFLREDAGTTLVEFAIVLPLFLLLFLGLIDFGRRGQEYVITETPMQLAARRAAGRPPARGSQCEPARRSACQHGPTALRDDVRSRRDGMRQPRDGLLHRRYHQPYGRRDLGRYLWRHADPCGSGEPAVRLFVRP